MAITTFRDHLCKLDFGINVCIHCHTNKFLWKKHLHRPCKLTNLELKRLQYFEVNLFLSTKYNIYGYKEAHWRIQFFSLKRLIYYDVASDEFCWIIEFVDLEVDDSENKAQRRQPHLQAVALPSPCHVSPSPQKFDVFHLLGKHQGTSDDSGQLIHCRISKSKYIKSHLPHPDATNLFSETEKFDDETSHRPHRGPGPSQQSDDSKKFIAES